MKVFGIRIGPKFHAVKPIGQKTSLTWKVTRLLYTGQEAIFMPKNYTAFARQGYQACVDVFACVDWIARAISGIPLLLYTKPRIKGGERKEVENHPVLDLLRRPNPGQGQAAFIDALLRYYLISGNSYPEAVMVDGLPRELYALRPDRIQVLVGDIKNQIKGYRYDAGGQKQDFVNGEVLHLKTFHPTDDFYGLSPIEIAAIQIDMSNAGSASNAKLLQNDLRPAGLFLFEKEMTEEQRKEFKASMKDSYLDVSNKGLPLVLDGKADYRQLSVTSKDADFIELDRAITRKICRVYSLPPELIGDAANKTYSNYKEARLAGYMEVALPIAFWLRDELNNWLLRKYEKVSREGEIGSQPQYELDWDLDKVEALQEKKSEAYARMAGAWWTTINEKRVACGYDEQLGGGICLIPMGMTEYDLTKEEREIPEPPDTFPEEEPPAEEEPENEEVEKSIQHKSYWKIPEHKKALWLTYERRVKVREKSFENIAKKYLLEQAKELQSKISKLSNISTVNPKALINKDEAIKKYTKDFKAWYKDHFIRAGNAGMQATKGDLFKDEEFKAAEPTSWTFTMSKEQEKKLMKMVFESGTEITKTTIQKIYDTLLTAQAQNMTIEQFTQAIHEKVSDMSIWRARMWARTESVKVDGFGQLEGFKETEFVEKKGWMCAFVKDSRDDHMKANDQEVKLNEDFNVGGEAMAFPGDPRGSAGNVVNCMCGIYPVVEA